MKLVILTHDAAIQTPANHPHQEEQVTQEVFVIVCTWKGNKHRHTHHNYDHENG